MARLRPKSQVDFQPSELVLNGTARHGRIGWERGIYRPPEAHLELQKYLQWLSQ